MIYKLCNNLMSKGPIIKIKSPNKIARTLKESEKKRCCERPIF